MNKASTHNAIVIKYEVDRSDSQVSTIDITRSSAVAERLRDASCH